ncbi:MAG TPA: response regulator, partial [Polyangiales bacterium]
ADDNADMREYIVRLLEQHWTVVAVADGAEALDVARRIRFDLILSDVMMPRLDGFGLIRELRADPRTSTLPVILLSARAGEEATAEGLRAGADDYLVKPFSASALVVRVEAQLSAARMRETLRQNAEAEIARLETLFRESPAAIALLRGPSLIVELANPLILRFWGKDGSIIGTPFATAVPEIAEQGFADLLRRVYETGIAHKGKEVLARLPDGEGGLQDTYFDFVYAPMRGADGGPEGVFVHAYDVSDSVRARHNIEQLRAAEEQARQDAEAANRLKDEFLATMSHELRTPLNAILGWASLLQRGVHDGDSTRRALATIERNAKTQARLIEDVLDVSRIISGKLRLDMRRVDTSAVARAALDVVRPAAEAKRVQLIVDLAPADGVELIADADRLQQVLWNLLSNAVKFTPADGTVALRVERHGSAARFVVRDTGPGIAREHLPFVFERFRQIDSSIARKHGGLGLGLAIVRHLVELHGGSVSAESAGPGQGSTFTVNLPIRAVHEASSATGLTREFDPSQTSPGVIAIDTFLSGVSVLVVDDDEDARYLLESALERLGARVSTADSARGALVFLESQQVDVLISDIGMPGEDGFSLMKRVRALPAHRGGQVPAIALTAYARNEDVARALAVGFMRHLSKPADVDELAQAVAKLVEARRTAS